MGVKRRQTRKQQFREIRPRLTMANWSYVNALDTDSSYSKNVNRIIEEHRKLTQGPQHTAPSKHTIQ